MDGEFWLNVHRVTRRKWRELPAWGLKPGGPIRVVTFRDIPPGYVEVARKWGVKVGGAYVQKDRDKFEYICDVDLKLSDEDIAKTFGVENKFRGR